MLESFEDIVEDFIVVFVGGCVDDVVDVDDVVFDLVEYLFPSAAGTGPGSPTNPWVK